MKKSLQVIINRDKQFHIFQEEWNTITKNVFTITNDTKLQWIQYRINHTIFVTNLFLLKTTKIYNDICTFCAEERELVEHVLYD